VSRPVEDKQVVFKDWRIVKARRWSSGNVKPVAQGRWQVEFRLYDIYKEKQLAGYSYVVAGEPVRACGTPASATSSTRSSPVEPGVFSTRIAYVTRERNGKRFSYKLQIADSDGYNPVTVLSSWSR